MDAVPVSVTSLAEHVAGLLDDVRPGPTVRVLLDGPSGAELAQALGPVLLAGARGRRRRRQRDLLASGVAAVRRRLLDDDAWQADAFADYERLDRPDDTADVVVRWDDPRRPALVVDRG